MVSKPSDRGRASISIYVTLNTARNREGDDNLQAPRTLHGSRRSREARRKKRKLNRSRAIKKADQAYLVLGSARADFSKPP